MKNRIVLLIGALIMLSAIRAHCQHPQITFQQPLAAQTHSWSINLSDATGKPLSVILKVTIEFEKQGSVMAFTTQKISFQSSLNVPWKELTEKYLNTSSIQSNFKDGFYGYRDLPMGNYQICYSLMSEEHATLTEDCNSFIVEYTGILPPVLIAPANGDTIRQTYPMFTWTPPAPSGDIPVSYELFLFEISKGQTPEGAVVKNQPHHTAKEIKEPFYNYPPDALTVKEHQAYAWQILAHVDKEIYPSNIEHFVVGNGGNNPGTPGDSEEIKEREGLMYFQLSKNETNNFYHLGKPHLYFVYVNENTNKALTYSILNAEGDVVTEGKLEATYGYNLLSLDLTAIPLEKNSFCQLLINKDHEPTQQLLFLFNPEN